MTILGIETSCDETAAAVVDDGQHVRANVVASSIAIHAKYGGVVPEKAAREQLAWIIPVVNEALTRAGVHPDALDAIAVTTGPGLIGSLLVGVETAKTLSLVWKKPIIPIHHLLAHFFADPPPPFPFLGLLVSGGHTDIIRMNSPTTWTHLGGTMDDAAGEAFDKTARLLRLPYPGGPALATLAARGHATRFPLPRPMIRSNDNNVSFSGLKTAVVRMLEKHPVTTAKDRADYAAAIQAAIVDVLVAKTIRAARQEGLSRIALAGGVAANTFLRTTLRAALPARAGYTIYSAPVRLCTDNAVMVARAAFEQKKVVPWHKVHADPMRSLAHP